MKQIIKWLCVLAALAFFFAAFFTKEAEHVAIEHPLPHIAYCHAQSGKVRLMYRPAAAITNNCCFLS